ncbi:MGH1-like glycoside hydrolase domain-containing protein [Pedobacter cryoconitis]|uniref:Putative isomerase n=1 Tax=Pedobacter cryoconitis TaxID=188932 RepID=A0A7X0MKK1_9SPHI|nr:trehalase family glycosidase [Pedobacter cryoconitis]MBB6502156.1 putative isomerase [Pedobacter cryoconitis]
MKRLLFVVLSFSLSTTFGQNQRDLFPDVLRLGYEVKTPTQIEANVFSDLGAWHAYTLPSAPKDYGAFIGPMVMDMNGQWLANTLAKLRFSIDGEDSDPGQGKISQHYYPGFLQQDIRMADLSISLQLIFVSDRTAMIRTRITSQSSKRHRIGLSWSGSCLLKDTHLKQQGDQIWIDFNQGHSFLLNFPAKDKLSYQLTGKGYTAVLPERILEPGEVFETTHTESYYLDKAEIPVKAVAYNFNQQFLDNQSRWDQYLDSYFNAPGVKLADSIQRRLAVKSIVTLMTNWRSKAKDLLHDGVFPSLNYQGFYGFWSWDSWKQAVGLSYFFPALARENMLAMFDYQDQHGMIADCIYTDQKENNWRDTKPPLAAWAVWEIYQRKPDRKFLERIYPKLVSYHRWWYKNRDHNQNGLCEYGSADGTRVAALWESGMDNAVRFDQAVLLQNNASAWSLNQESVDLNAYLYAEKSYLAKIALTLGLDQDAANWNAQLSPLKKLINDTFYQEAKGFYYDKMLDGSWVEVTGTEGWIPLWAGIASQKQAASVLRMMEKENKFNTPVPMPTLAADHPAFDPLKGYWRGPVWLDQVYFGLNGLHQYGYDKEASEFLIKLLQNANGLTGREAIRENYHPVSGKGLNAINFSWSAAHLLLMLKENTL